LFFVIYWITTGVTIAPTLARYESENKTYLTDTFKVIFSGDNANALSVTLAFLIFAFPFFLAVKFFGMPNHLKNYVDESKAKKYNRYENAVKAFSAVASQENAKELTKFFYSNSEASSFKAYADHWKNKSLGVKICAVILAILLPFCVVGSAPDLIVDANGFLSGTTPMGKVIAPIVEFISHSGQNYYNLGQEMLENGKTNEAIICFANAGKYSDAQEQKARLISEKRSEYVQTYTLSPSSSSLLNKYKICYDNGISPDGKPMDYIAMYVHLSHTVALLSDGRVVYYGNEEYGRENVGGWTDVISIVSTGNATFGLKKDGSIVGTGKGFRVEQSGNFVDIATKIDSYYLPDASDAFFALGSDGLVYRIYSNGVEIVNDNCVNAVSFEKGIYGVVCFDPDEPDSLKFSNDKRIFERRRGTK